MAFLLAWFLIFLVATQKLSLLFLRKSIEKDARLNSILVRQGWSLLFNPETRRSKTITFLEDGNIGEGVNNNETTWRVRDGTLEILNRDGKVFSRFRYNDDQKRFEHTNDDDTLSMRHQVITPTT